MNILKIKNLHTYFNTKDGLIRAVNGVSLDINSGETLAVIGESGSGKSQTAMSVLQLFEKNQKIYDGEIIFDGNVISNYTKSEIQNIRGNDISIIFQEPMTSLNPVFTVGEQISEVLITHKKIKKKEALNEALKMLKAVKIPNPEKIINNYPHQLSGGMRQRVMIAIALILKPKLLLADEPTTALDVTIQAQILQLLIDMQKEYNTAIMFITHDLGIVNNIADKIAVMYSGQIVELSLAKTIFKKDGDYIHPYTNALLESLPHLSMNRSRLPVIEGTVPHPLNLPKGCKFSTRCQFANNNCKENEPPLNKINDNHYIRCFYPNIVRLRKDFSSNE